MFGYREVGEGATVPVKSANARLERVRQQVEYAITQIGLITDQLARELENSRMSVKRRNEQQALHDRLRAIADALGVEGRQASLHPKSISGLMVILASWIPYALEYGANISEIANRLDPVVHETIRECVVIDAETLNLQVDNLTIRTTVISPTSEVVQADGGTEVTGKASGVLGPFVGNDRGIASMREPQTWEGTPTEVSVKADSGAFGQSSPSDQALLLPGIESTAEVFPPTIQAEGGEPTASPAATVLSIPPSD